MINFSRILIPLGSVQNPHLDTILVGNVCASLKFIPSNLYSPPNSRIITVYMHYAFPAKSRVVSVCEVYCV